LYSDKQYIACQGPLEDTSEDFWEMIIQYKVLKIVMLTKIQERNPHNPNQPLVIIIFLKINFYRFYIKILGKMFSVFS